MTDEEKEQPVDFIPEFDVFGQPIQNIEITQPTPLKAKYKHNLEPSFLIDRFLAGIIDALLLGIALHFIIDLWLFPNQGFSNSRTSLNVSLLVACLYHGFFDSSAWQGTPGKRWLGIKIANSKERQISFLRSVGRYLASGISILALLLGYINIYINKDKQAWHDILAGTYVIKDKEVDDSTAHKKRKNGYVIASILFIFTCMIFMSQYTQELDEREQKTEAEQKKSDEKNTQKFINNLRNTAKTTSKDFIYRDSARGFQIIVKKGCMYSINTPQFNFIAMPSDSSILKIGWMVSKDTVPDNMAGNYLENYWKEKKNTSISNIKIYPPKNGYGIEQGIISNINSAGDTVCFIVRTYIKNKIVYSLTIINNLHGKPINEDETTKQIFDSFQITE